MAQYSPLNDNYSNAAPDIFFDYSSLAWQQTQQAPAFEPQLEPQFEPQPEPELTPQPQPQRKRKFISKELLRKQERVSYKKAAKIFVVSLAVLAVFSVTCNSFVQVRQSRIEMIKQQSELAIYSAKQKELDVKLASMVTVDKIEKIAVAKLGMVKLSEENKIYVNTAEKNKIVNID